MATKKGGKKAAKKAGGTKKGGAKKGGAKKASKKRQFEPSGYATFYWRTYQSQGLRDLSKGTTNTSSEVRRSFGFCF